MADQTGGHSSEQVAYMLLERIASCEGKALAGHGDKADRKWILDTYAECLIAVRRPDARNQP
jgi:hypothetical protein